MGDAGVDRTPAMTERYAAGPPDLIGLAAEVIRTALSDRTKDARAALTP